MNPKNAQELARRILVARNNVDMLEVGRVTESWPNRLQKCIGAMGCRLERDLH